MFENLGVTQITSFEILRRTLDMLNSKRGLFIRPKLSNLTFLKGPDRVNDWHYPTRSPTDTSLKRRKITLFSEKTVVGQR